MQHLFYYGTLVTPVLLTSAVILYCTTNMFSDTRNILSEMSLFIQPRAPISSKTSSKFLIFVQISSKIVNFVFHKNAKIRNFIRFLSKMNLLHPYLSTYGLNRGARRLSSRWVICSRSQSLEPFLEH